MILEPRNPQKYHAIIMEFKVHRPRKEKDLKASALLGLRQIDDKAYGSDLIARGIRVDYIYKYGIAFRGKEIWIEGGR